MPRLRSWVASAALRVLMRVFACAGGGVELSLAYAFYAAPLAAILYFHLRSRKGEQVRSLHVKAQAVEAGLTEPASLHPVVDPAKCMGCGSCVAACPEGQILGLIDNKAQLIEPTQCIGHGACKTACPFDAISLVFGTETRGIELPVVASDFQSNVPGLYIAGELGGMGLIRNAIEQGVQAMEHIVSKRSTRSAEMLDVLIVGAGPAGFAASLSAMEHKLSFATVEQDTLGGTVAHFPRGKLVMTQPALLPIVGLVKFRETTKEALLEFWTGVQAKTGLAIQFQERVEAVSPLKGGGFEVRTTSQTYRTQAVLLAIGRRGTPRKLEVPGEEQSKVVYRLADAEQYRGQHVLVVGGGDSAIEAAASIAEEPDTTVTLSYRSDTFQRSKLKNRKRIEGLVAAGRVNVIFNSSVKSIGADNVVIATKTDRLTLANDAVIVCAGGILPNKFLEACGISVETKYGTE
jgi:thioredoxin reductase (NADPH)